MGDTYYTLRGYARSETKVKGSRFIAEAIQVERVEEVEAEIAAIRKRAYNATHHCIAYRIGPAGDIFRYHDDGEPSGTAGPPILRQIDARLDGRGLPIRFIEASVDVDGTVDGLCRQGARLGTLVVGSGIRAEKQNRRKQ